MGSKHIYHHVRRTSFWRGTWTSWCGITIRKEEADTRGSFLRWGGKDCPACMAAKKGGGRR